MYTRETYRGLGVPYRRGFILTGPAGCGKTITLKALANETSAEFVALQTRANLKDHEVAEAFRYAEKHSPAVLILEDLDRLVASPGVSLSYLLNRLDGLQISEGILVVATSNYPDRLDPALLHRPSRFDRIWNFPLPGHRERRLLLDRRGARFFSEAALQRAAAASKGFSMSYVQEIVLNALLISAREGGSPTDEHLAQSLETLRAQRKATAKEQESLIERENIGFTIRRRWHDDIFDEEESK